MLLLPIQIPHTKNWRSGGDGSITNLWPGGSARPPDTCRASGFALHDTVRVSGGRRLPADQRFASLQSAGHLYGDLYGGEEHRGEKHRSEGSRHRLTPSEGSNSTSLPPSWRGTARLRSLCSSSSTSISQFAPPLVHTGHTAVCPVCHAFQWFPALGIGAYRFVTPCGHM